MENDKNKTEQRAPRRRSGGRAARHAVRMEVAPSAAVTPGVSGGTFKPLSESDVAKVNESVLHILETLGIGDPTEELLEIALL